MPSYTDKSPRPKRTRYVSKRQFNALFTAFTESLKRISKLESSQRRLLASVAIMKREQGAEIARVDRIQRDTREVVG